MSTHVRVSVGMREELVVVEEEAVSVPVAGRENVAAVSENVNVPDAAAGAERSVDPAVVRGGEAGTEMHLMKRKWDVPRTGSAPDAVVPVIVKGAGPATGSVVAAAAARNVADDEKVVKMVLTTLWSRRRRVTTTAMVASMGVEMFLKNRNNRHPRRLHHHRTTMGVCLAPRHKKTQNHHRKRMDTENEDHPSFPIFLRETIGTVLTFCTCI